MSAFLLFIFIWNLDLDWRRRSCLLFLLCFSLLYLFVSYVHIFIKIEKDCIIVRNSTLTIVWHISLKRAVFYVAISTSYSHEVRCLFHKIVAIAEIIIRSRVSVVAHFARLVWCPTHPCIFCDSGCPSRRGNNQTLTRRRAAVYGETFTISAYLLRNKSALVKRPSAFYVLIEKFSRVWATTFTDLISYRWLLISTSGPQGILLIAGPA